jgi:hypothetical protein
MEQEKIAMERRNKNKETILQEIMKKNTNTPYFADHLIYSVENDYDVFPYTRWFKGIPTNDNPRISEREAGWAPKKIVVPAKKKIDQKPNLCFQSACSTVYPCYAQDSSYISLNKACINQYR